MPSVQRTTVTLALVGVIAWTGLALIALQLAARSALGFDLELLLEAGRAVAAGQQPYDPALLAGTAPDSVSLFYSYPPPVAQALALFAGIPSTIMLLVWWAGALAGSLVAAEVLRRRLAPAVSGRDLGLAIAALSPLVLPFAVGLLFGNLDAWFPLLYGTMLLAALASSPGTAVAGGTALAVAALKLHPASLGVWFLVRFVRDRSGGGRRVVMAACAAALAIVAASLIVGGTGPWSDYARVVQAGAGADIVDPRNAGPAAVITAWSGGDEAMARSLHIGVGVLAVLVTAAAAWWRPDPLESFAWAAVASLATLPVTWYHYPSALIPVAIAALLRAPGARRMRTRGLIVAAGVTAAVAIAALPLLWVAAGLVIAATIASRPAESAPGVG